MISTAEAWWPYLFLAAGWSAICGFLLLRGRKTPASPVPIAADAETSLDEPVPWEHDTQAGRM